MDPEAQGRQEGPFEMRAEDAGYVRLGRNLAEGGEELLFGGGDEGREERRDAGLEDGVGRLAVAVGVGGGEVDTRETVDLEVDEARHGDAAPVRRRQPEAADPAAEDLDVARNELPVDDGRFDAESHSPSSSAAAMLRSERSSRCRAIDASIPARRETIATRASPSAAASASSTCCCEAPLAVATMRRTRAASLSFAAATSTMRFP